MPGKYQFRRDSLNRLQADIAEDVTIGIKVLAVTDERRMERGTHAYGVMDIRTPLGVIRIRDIRVQWSEQNQRHFVRWRQWNTGRIRDGRKEYLDVAGPLDADTRAKFADKILEVFAQIKEEAELGTLGKTHPELLELKAQLELQAAEQAEAQQAEAEAATTEAQ